MKIMYSILIPILCTNANIETSEQSDHHCINKILNTATERPALYAAINDCIKNRNWELLNKIFECNQPGQKNYQEAAGILQETYNKYGIKGTQALQEDVRKLFHNQEHPLLLNNDPLEIAQKYNDLEIIELYKSTLIRIKLNK